MKRYAMMLGLWLVMAGSLCAQSATVPKILTDGFDAYKKEGSAKAFDTWLLGSPIEKDTTTRLSVLGGITQIEAAYGKYQGYDLLGIIPFGTTVKRYYFVMNYEKGPVYTWFEVYTINGKDNIPSTDLNTKANLILPATFIEKK